MLGLLEYLQQMIMTSSTKNPYPGLPEPITELTMEQDLKLRLTYDSLINPKTTKEDMITVFMALQEQNFVLGNSLTNLVKKWPKPPDPDITKEDESKSGILFVINDSTST